MFGRRLVARDRDFWPHAWSWFASNEAAVRARGGEYVPVHGPETAYRRPPHTLDARPHWFFGIDAVQDLPSTFVAVVPEGHAVGGSGAVFAPDGRMLADLSREFATSPTDHAALRGELPPAVRVEGTVVVLSSPGSGIYYHWLLDVLPRLEIARRAGFGPEGPARFLVDGGARPFQRETLARLGIGAERVLDAAEHPHVVADRLVVPSYPGRSEHPPRWVVDFLRRLLPAEADEPGTGRIYLSRSDAACRRVANESRVERALAARGFRSVRLAGLPVAEQAALFASAHTVVGPHGSGLANLAFCKPGARVVELFAPGYVNPCFWSLANQAGVEYAYLLGEGPRPPDYVHPHEAASDVVVDLAALERLLDRLETTCPAATAGASVAAREAVV
ncbi:MAG TPA: glycosyltransferase family 61 protein [Longimicrobiaceae bacterium]|nr:glycosyltransferase family 61 protein [Longimicrobiaceae bacterium]